MAGVFLTSSFCVVLESSGSSNAASNSLFVHVELGIRTGLVQLIALSSGVAKLGHTGARALATRDCAPPVQALVKIIGTECTVINRELGAKSGQRC